MGARSEGILKRAALGAAGLGLLVYLVCVKYIKPCEQGVKQTIIAVPLMTGSQGYEKRVYGGGKYYWVWPVLQTMHTLPGTVQQMSFNEVQTEKEQRDYLYVVSQARIETPDNFYVDMDADIYFRITDPVATILGAGPGKQYLAVLDKYALNGLKMSLGASQPEDFFEVNAETGKVKRIEAQKRAAATLTERMKPFGITVEDVRIRQTIYVADVQKNFEQKSIEDQKLRTNKAKALLQENTITKVQITTQGKQAAEVRKREGEAYRDAKNGEIESYTTARHSEGDKLVALAKAESARLQNEAYQGGGSGALVGLEMAKNLCNLDRIIMPVCGTQNNILDIETMTKLLSGEYTPKPASKTK
jgi:regulator of protease activity HflC (stomatin/prohibitin superfamily)